VAAYLTMEPDGLPTASRFGRSPTPMPTPLIGATVARKLRYSPSTPSLPLRHLDRFVKAEGGWCFEARRLDWCATRDSTLSPAI
jgi:hypothetical protein